MEKGEKTLRVDETIIIIPIYSPRLTLKTFFFSTHNQITLEKITFYLIYFPFLLNIHLIFTLQVFSLTDTFPRVGEQGVEIQILKRF